MSVGGLLNLFGVQDHSLLARTVAVLLIVKVCLLLLLVCYVIYKRLKRLVLRRDNRARAAAFRDAILAYAEAQLTDAVPDTQLFKKALRSRSNSGFLRRVLIAQIHAAENRDKKIMQNLYRDLGFLQADFDRTDSMRWWKRLDAIVRLESTEIKEAAPFFIKAMDDSNELVSLAAIRALSQTDYPDKARLVLDALSRKAPSRRDLFEDVLMNLGEDDPKSVIEFLRECYDPYIATVCIDVIARLGINYAISELRVLLKSSDDEVVSHSVAALRNLNLSDQIPNLEELIAHPSPLVRAEAARTLRLIDPQRSFRILRELAADSSREVRRIVYEAEREAS